MKSSSSRGMTHPMTVERGALVNRRRLSTLAVAVAVALALAGRLALFSLVLFCGGGGVLSADRAHSHSWNEASDTARPKRPRQTGQ